MKIHTLDGHDCIVLAWAWTSPDPEWTYKRAYIQEVKSGAKYWIAAELLQFQGYKGEKFEWFDDEALAIKFCSDLNGRYRLVRMLGQHVVAYCA